jgi:hypothetical protein
MKVSTRRWRYGTVIAVALCGFAASSLSAQQSLYKKTDDGWFIYKEEKSCVLYADFPNGTMIRISNRTDEARLYFLALNDAWKPLKPRVGETLMMFIEFPTLRRVWGSAAMIIENDDGRIGFTGDAFPVEETLRGLSNEKGFTLKVMYEREDKPTLPGNFGAVGAAMAVTHLTECSLQYFESQPAR